MNVLVACECSGRVKAAFRLKGHNAYSCDLKPSEIPDDKFHFKGDAIYWSTHGEWDLLIVHPDCTYLAVSGARWWDTRCLEQRQAIDFVMFFANLDIPKIAIENPVGKLSTAWRKPDQIIHPWWFGENESKATCLWLKGLPKLVATHSKPEVIVWRMPPSDHRKTDRARTFQGIANAMAEQWG